MKPEDKTSKIVKAVKEKHEASKKKTTYILKEGWTKKNGQVYFKKDTILHLTPSNYKDLAAKGVKMTIHVVKED